MKKQIKNVALVVALVASLSSCKKTYECHCDKVGGGDEHFDFKEKEKSDAETKCKAKQTENTTKYTKCMLE